MKENKHRGQSLFCPEPPPRLAEALLLVGLAGSSLGTGPCPVLSGLAARTSASDFQSGMGLHWTFCQA